MGNFQPSTFNPQSRKVYAFDFDGTLTTRDTLIELIRYVHGTTGLWWGLLRYSPLLVLMKIGFYPNWKVKQKVFAYYFGGMSIEIFDELCHRFATDNAHLLREKGVQEIKKALNKGSQVLIVSASIDNWIRPFFENLSFLTVNSQLSTLNSHPSIIILGTKIEVKDGRLTGRFLTKNCYGAEKVSRIREVLPERSEYELIAYGDSRGDKEMLAYANQGYYQPFR